MFHMRVGTESLVYTVSIYITVENILLLLLMILMMITVMIMIIILFTV